MESQKIAEIIDPACIQQIDEFYSRLLALQSAENSVKSLNILKLDAISRYIAAQNSNFGLVDAHRSVETAQFKAIEIIKAL